MEKTITQEQLTQIAEIIGVHERAVRSNLIKLSDTPKEAASKLYKWEGDRLAAARIAKEKAGRINRAAFLVLGGRHE